MKNLAFLIGITFVYFWQSDNYTVNFISPGGRVFFASNGRPVHVRDIIKSGEKLVFNDKKTKMVVLSPRLGSMDVNWRGFNRGKSGALVAELRELISPPLKVGSFDTRSMDDGIEPATYFNASEADSRILLISGEKLQVTTDYLMDEYNFFFLQWSEKGNVMTSRIKTKGHAFLFEQTDFKTGSIPYAICYQSEGAGKATSELLANFVPVIISQASAADQADMVNTCFADRPLNERKNILLTLLNHNYGKIGPEAIKTLFGH